MASTDDDSGPDALAKEITSYINVNLGIPRFSLTAGIIDNTIHHGYLIPMIRQWLIMSGVDETTAHGASDYVLCQAFSIGNRYVNKMIDNAGLPKKRAPKGFVGLDLDNLLDQPVGNNDPPVPVPNYPSTPLSIDPNSIAHAAEEVLNKALTRFKSENLAALSASATTIQDRLAQAVDRRWTEALETFETKTKSLVAETKDLILELAAKQIPHEINVKSGNITRTLPAEIRHESFSRILRWLLAGENVYIVGPAGTGKTHLAKQLATALDKELFLPSQALTKYDISGYKGPTGEYFGTCVRNALEFGGLLFVDEGDMWAAAALGFLNAPLANGWCSFPDKTIEVHPNFQCIIAANTFGRGATQEYIGRNPLDAASIDRFAFEIVEYDETLEKLLYGDGPWTQYCHRVRAAVVELKFRHIISMRAINRVLRGIAAGLSVDEVCFSALWRGLDKDTIGKIKSLAGEPPRVLKVVEDEELENDLRRNGTDK